MTEGPIERHVFYDLFHACYDDGAFLHRLHSSLSWSICDVLAKGLLGYLPKRRCDISIDAQFDKMDLVGSDSRNESKLGATNNVKQYPFLPFLRSPCDRFDRN